MRGLDMAERRAADALVRMLGASEAWLEMPAPPVAGDDGELLGLRAPEFFAKVLAPVAIRFVKGNTELLVAANVLEELLCVHGFGAVRAAMTAVYAVVVGDVRYRLVRVECVASHAEACAYRLLLEQPGTEAV
jgi:hypothetical protein